MIKEYILRSIKKINCRLANIVNRVRHIEENCCNGSGGGIVDSVVGGEGISVDNTDPSNPIVSSTYKAVENIVAGDNVVVDNTDPQNPKVSVIYDGIEEIIAGEKIVVDNTNPKFPVISSSYSAVENIIAGGNITVDNSDPNNPIVSATFDVDFDHMESVLYADLVTKLEAGELVPGMQYRIIDYVTTTNTDEDWYRSANNPFDIIVIADSTNNLNESARVTWRDGDTYFPVSADLNSWEIKYSIYNDKLKYSWAKDGGYGVIHYMKDNNGNVAYYDLKNIQFRRYLCTDNGGNPQYNEFVGKYVVAFTGRIIPSLPYDPNDYIYSYTFSDSSDNSDISSVDATGNFLGISISSTVLGEEGHGIKSKLNNIVFTQSTEGEFNVRIHDNFFGSDSSNNTFGSGASNNTFGSRFSNNTFGSGASNNTFGSDSSYNTFGSGASNNTFGSDSSYNTFGSGASNNTFGDNTVYNRFGDNVVFNIFGENISGNTFEGDVMENTFRDTIHQNTFGRDTYSNTFGSGLQNNIFRNNASAPLLGNSFGDYVKGLDYEPTGVSSYPYGVILNIDNSVQGECIVTASNSCLPAERLDINMVLDSFSTTPNKMSIEATATIGKYLATSIISETEREVVEITLDLL